MVPAYNAGPTIFTCLDALLADGALGVPDAEVIVVDDASTDDTAARVEARHPAVRLLRLARNVGADAARNIAVARARGRVIAFVDADCAVRPGWRRAVLAAVRPGAPVSMGRVEAPPDFLQRTLALLEQGEFLAPAPRAIANFATLNVALDGALARARPFDEPLRTCGDRALSWDLHREGVPIRFEPAQVVLHAPPVTWRSVLARRSRYAEAFLRVRRRDPSLPGARLLALGPIAAPLVLAARLPRDLARLLGARRALGIPARAVPLHALALAGLRAIESGFLLARLLGGQSGRR